jgi:hypothetical protein
VRPPAATAATSDAYPADDGQSTIGEFKLASAGARGLEHKLGSEGGAAIY